MNKLIRNIKRPRDLSIKILGWLSWLIPSDSLYLRMRYFLFMKKPLHLKKPKTFNEKLQWLKLYDRNPLYTSLVDKYEVKEYVAERIGREHIIPTIGVWDSVEEIDFDSLPDKFVLKCTHDSGGLLLCKDKSMLNIQEVRRSLNKVLKRNYYKVGREWPYKNVRHRIIAEAYMKDEKSVILNDYKFFCFDGEVKILFVATDRGVDTRFDFFDRDFNHLDIINGHLMSEKKIEKPSKFDEMISIAETLSKDIPHVRVDLYEINEVVYFGEMTFSHWGGTVPFEPEEWDYKLGRWLKLPQKRL